MTPVSVPFESDKIAAEILTGSSAVLLCRKVSNLRRVPLQDSSVRVCKDSFFSGGRLGNPIRTSGSTQPNILSALDSQVDLGQVMSDDAQAEACKIAFSL
jgi:hypothetical protein